MRRIFPLLVAAAAIFAGGVMYLFVLSGETAHTGPVPQAGEETESRAGGGTH